MAKKSSIWFNGSEYRWNDKYDDYVREIRKFGRLRYGKYQDDRKNFFRRSQNVVRYAGAEGAKGIQGIQGVSGIQGIGGAKKNTIWYNGYRYEWDDEIGDYVHWVKKGKTGIPMIYREVKAKNEAEQSETSASKQEKNASAEEQKKDSFYKGFDSSSEGMAKYQEYLKKLSDDELGAESGEINDYQTEIGMFDDDAEDDEDYSEKEEYVIALMSELQGEIDRREEQKAQREADRLSQGFPSFEYRPLKSVHKFTGAGDVDKFKEYLTSLKNDAELKAEENILKKSTSRIVREWEWSLPDGISDDVIQPARATLIKKLLDAEEPFRHAIRDELWLRKEIGDCRKQFRDSLVYNGIKLGGKALGGDLKRYLQTLPDKESVDRERKKIMQLVAQAQIAWKKENQNDFDAPAFERVYRGVSEENTLIANECAAMIERELERRRMGGQPISIGGKQKIEKFVPDVSSFPESVSEVKIVNDNLGGSTGAKMVEDSHGNRYVMKTGNSPEHIRSEAFADAFYQASGVKVPGFKLYESEDGTPIKLATEIRNATALGKWWDSASDADRDKMRAKLRRGYAADVLLGNWDVVGLDSDNILIDEDGEPWRIDNGGSMKFRAQGALKNSEGWGKYCDDLFTMTGNGEVVGRKKSSGITKYFGETRPLELAQEINATDWSEALKSLPDDERKVVENRLEEIRQIAERGSDAERYGRTAESTDRMLAFSYQLTRDGMREALPKEIDLEPIDLIDWKTRSGWLCSDNTTATLGGKEYGSLGEYLADKMGADNFNVMQSFNEAQGNASYHEIESVSRKLCVFKSQGFDCLKYDDFETFLRDVEEAGYYSSYHKEEDHSHRKNFKAAFDGYKKFPDTFKSNCEAVDQFDAAVQLILENVRLKNVDPVTRTVILGRTEKAKYFQGPPGSNEVPNAGERTYHHTGACESHSRIQYVCVEGYGLTLVRVPFSRIHGLWMMERGNAWPDGKYQAKHEVQFMAPEENEIIADTHGLPIIYIEDLEMAKTKYKQKYFKASEYIGFFEQWEKEHPEQAISVTTGATGND